MSDNTDPNIEVDLDDLTDDEVLERCRRAREETREIELVRGLQMMGAKNWSEDTKLGAFMHVFHPDRAPRSMVGVRRMRGNP